MKIKNAKVLVTGADGFIGSHLTQMLCEDNYEVTALVNYNSMGSWGWLDTIDSHVLSNINIVMGDVRDRNFMQECIKGKTLVFHLAALISIPYSYHAPYAYVDTNLLGTMNVLESAMSAGCEKVICTSTSEVYGTAQFIPITEEHPLNAQSPYAASKVAADQMALSYYRSFGLPVSILRPFNTFGPRQSTRAVIPAIITQVSGNNESINLGNLGARRDFTFVKDTAKGFIQFAESNSAVGKVINIGSGFDITIKELAEQIINISGKNISIKQDKNRMRPEESEVDILHADISKAESIFNWNPEYGYSIDNFTKALQLTYEWFNQLENMAFYSQGKFLI